jgi:hypothetical protein
MGIKTFLDFIKESQVVKFPKKRSVFDKLSSTQFDVEPEEKAIGYDKAAEWNEFLEKQPNHRAHRSPEAHRRDAQELRRAASEIRAKQSRQKFKVIK